jgi:hypothetical protein
MLLILMVERPSNVDREGSGASSIWVVTMQLFVPGDRVITASA